MGSNYGLRQFLPFQPVRQKGNSWRSLPRVAPPPPLIDDDTRSTTANERNSKNFPFEHARCTLQLVPGCLIPGFLIGFINYRNGLPLIMPLARDLLHPSPEDEKRKHKLKRLVQEPNSYFMDVKCPGCYKITTVFSHAQSVVICAGCSTVLCQPTGGRARLTEGCSFRKKQH